MNKRYKALLARIWAESGWTESEKVITSPSKPTNTGVIRPQVTKVDRSLEKAS